MNFPPTPEQQAALDAFATGENMVIEAGAGTGKTSTLQLLAESTDRQGIYLAFNASVAKESVTKFPSNVECRTIHAVANRALRQTPEGSALLRRLGGPYINSAAKVAILGIPQGGFQISDDQMIPAWMIAREALQAVTNFCHSDSEELTERHVSKLEGVEDQAALKAYVLPFARKAWSDLSVPGGKLSWGRSHDYYLKVWALTHPTLRYDFILLDEAQDTNRVVAKLVTDQTHAQQILVGDSCQAIYGWRGAVDAMGSFNAAHRKQLSQSFRFGQPIADQANKFLGLLDATLRLTGFDKIASTIDFLTDPDAILCRTNAGVIQHAMAAQAQGQKVAIVGGTGEIKSFTEAARDLMSGRSTSHRDLAIFKSWHDVLQYVEQGEGQDLKVMVSMITKYGVEAILEVCEASVNDEKNADVIVSTAHKAKGREWNKVRIADDFKAPEEKGAMPSRPELMLMYVGITRAKQVLDHSSLSWVDDLVAA
jgi:hypothetical protein